MLVGMMNNPTANVLDEARWAVDQGFACLDLTIEAPNALVDSIDAVALQQIVQSAGLRVVGHTAWYLPFASAFEQVRRAAVAEVAATFPLMAQLGAQWVNVHQAFGAGMAGPDLVFRQNCRSFAELADLAEPFGLRIMVEHVPDRFFRLDEYFAIVESDARLGFHLDVGHAFIGGDKLEQMLQRLGHRLAHVHFSDNRGRRDDHLPLGAGKIDWPHVVRLLKGMGYDGTITLEVFCEERDYLVQSAEKLRAWWA